MVTLRSGIKTSDTDGRNGVAFKKDSPRSLSNMKMVVFVSLILDLLGFTVILPLFPALLDYYSKNDLSGLYATLMNAVSTFQNTLGVPERFNGVLFGGMLGSLFSLLQFLSSPLTGALSDVYGRKPILIISLLGVAASYGVWSVASSFALFVLARIVGGLSKGNVSLAYSIMTDVLDASNRAVGMGLIGVAFSIGFIVGPAVGAMFSKWGTSGWFAGSAVYALLLTMVNIVYIAAFFKETLPKSQRFKSLSSGLSQAWSLINPFALFSFRAIKDISAKERQNLVQLGLINFVYLFIYSGLEFTLTFVTHHQHGYNYVSQARMFVYLGLVMVAVQGGYMRRVREGREKITALRGLVAMIPAFVLIGWSRSTWMLYAGLTLYGFGSSLLVPCLTGLASVHGPATQKGTLLGIWRSLGALARATGPVVTATGFWCVGSGWCYTAGALCLLVPLFMLQRWQPWQTADKTR